MLLNYNPLNSGRPLPPHKDGEINKLILAKDGIAPPIDKINVIPTDWSKITPSDVKKWKAEFIEVFGSGTKKK